MLKPRRGGTLIELLVALLLLDLALISLAAVGALTVKRVGDASRRARASVAAANRVERLSAVPCIMAGSGAGTLEAQVTETWSASRRGRTLEISDSIAINTRQRERVVVRRHVAC